MPPDTHITVLLSAAADRFSCGCVLYMMLMGRAPFAGNSPSEIFRNTCHGRLGLGRGGASLWDKLPPAARELIVGLMQLDHNLRFTGEQAMSHRWLSMPDDPCKTDIDGDGEGKGEGGSANNGQQQQQQQRVSQEGSGGISGGRRRRERSKNGSHKGSRGSGGGTDKAPAAPASSSSSRGTAPVSTATSFATTP